MSLDAIAPCPSSPNCVSTLADPGDREHHMAPVPFAVPADEAVAAIVDVLGGHPRTAVTERGGRVVRAVCTMRFPLWKDDVTFVVDEDAGMVHFRSASRSGHSDLGKNRKRMRELVAELEPRLS